MKLKHQKSSIQNKRKKSITNTVIKQLIALYLTNNLIQDKENLHQAYIKIHDREKPGKGMAIRYLKKKQEKNRIDKMKRDNEMECRMRAR